MHLRAGINKADEAEPRRRPSIQERDSRMTIAAYRSRLEWILRIPVLEPLFTQGLEILGLPGPRKGIGLRAALNALPLENKYTLICWAFRRNRQRFETKFAERIDQDFGLDLFNTLELDEHLTLSQWNRFEEAFLFAIAKEHRRYKQAQSILFFLYRNLVEKIVSRAVFDSARHNDCIQEGCMALLHAIDKVEASNASMGAYARMWIRRQVKNFLMGERFAVHVPINLAAKALSQDTARKAAESENATEKLFVTLRQPALSLNEVSPDSGVAMSDHIPDEDAPSPRSETTHRDIRALVAKLVGKLTDKQREVLEMRYGLNGHSGTKTLAEVSRAIGISHQQVSMREKRALQKLECELSPYLREILT